MKKPRILFLYSHAGIKYAGLAKNYLCDADGNDKCVLIVSTKLDKITPSIYDIGISFLYPHKVPKEHLDGHTWINFHPAPLPLYRGRNVAYHAIMNGTGSFGGTIHYMDENFD